MLAYQYHNPFIGKINIIPIRCSAVSFYNTRLNFNIIKFIVTLISVILTSACTAGNANSTTSSVPETAVTTTAPAVTGTVMDRIDEPKAETTTAQTTAITAVTTTKPQETKIAETTTTTTATATAKPKPATTTTAATTKPAPEWTESKASGTKYVNTDCYSRKKAVLGADTVKLYSVNDKVTVTAKTDTGYYKLDTGAYIHSDYLSDSKVTQSAAPATKKTETPNPAEGKKVNFTVVTVRKDVPFYSDINCTNATSWVLGEGSEYTVVEVFDSKNCYKLSNGEYVKKEDVKKGKVSDIYRYPFDLEAIKKVIVDDAVNNYGLKNLEDPTWTPEGSTWFTPLVISYDLHPNVIKRDVESFAKDNIKGFMKKGDYFKVYIQDISEDLDVRDENGKLTKAYAIYFLRGQTADSVYDD